MAFNFDSAKMQAGYTVPVVLNTLPGSPTVHIEHLGSENRTLTDEILKAANADVPVKRTAGVAKKKTTKADLDGQVEDKRADLKHAIRKLEATHTDTGLEATDADIPLFIAALPGDTVELLWHFAKTADNFRRTPPADVKALAEK